MPESNSCPQHPVQVTNFRRLVPDPKQSKVLQLPNEVLALVFELFDDNTCRPPSLQWDYPVEQPWSIPLISKVCRQWKALAEPVLYRRVLLDFNNDRFRRDRRRTLVLGSFCRCPQLCSYVRQLKLYFPQNLSQKHLQTVLEVLDKLSGFVSELSLAGYSSPKVLLGLAPQISRMRVRKLIVSDCWCKFVLRGLLRYGEAEGLLDLTMSGRPYGLFYSQQRVDHYVLPPNRHYSAGIIRLAIVACDVQVTALYPLLSWPAALKKFELLDILHTAFAQSYDAYSIQRLLNLQRRSLEHVILGRFPTTQNPVGSGSPTHLPDLAGFGNLKRLQVSYYNLFGDDPITACAKLAAPMLEHLTIDADIEDQQLRLFRFFDDTYAAWMEGFARRRKTCFPDSKLTAVHLNYDWFHVTDHHQVGDAPLDPWPGRYLAPTKAVLSELGICFTATEPWYSEEEWFQILERQRLMEEEGEDTAREDHEEQEDDVVGSEVDAADAELCVPLPLTLDAGQQRVCNWLTFSPREEAASSKTNSFDGDSTPFHHMVTRE